MTRVGADAVGPTGQVAAFGHDSRPLRLFRLA